MSSNTIHHRFAERKRDFSPDTKTSMSTASPLEKESIKPAEDRTDRMVYVIFVSLLFDLLAFTIILPLLPSLLEHYRLHDDSGLYRILTEHIQWFQQLLGAPERYNSVLYGGFLGSMFSFLQFVSSPLVGGLSDYYGRKPLILLCSVGIALSYLLWALSSNFAIFVLARLIGGLSKGNISMAMSIITDVSSPRRRSRAMALVGVAFSLGFIVGPTIGAFFALHSKKMGNGQWFVLPSMLAFAFAIIDILILAFGLRETLPKEKRVQQISSAFSYAWKLLNVVAIFGFSAVYNVPRKQTTSLRTIGFIYFLYLFLYSALEFTVTFLMFHNFGYTSMDQAKVFLTTGIIMALLQGSVVRRIPEHSVRKCAVYSLYLLVPAFILIGIAKSSMILMLGMILYAISTAFTVTCLTTLVSKYGNDNQKGTVLGIFRSLGALARALGPVVGCVSFWCIGSRLTYISGGILLLIPTFILQSAHL